MPKTTAMESSARSSVQARRTVRQRTDWPLVFVLLGAATYLYLNLFALPNTPFLLSGDQVYFWMDAQRMLHGERIYLDFFQFTPPGTDLLYAALFKLFGPRVWVTNAAVLALGVARSPTGKVLSVEQVDGLSPPGGVGSRKRWCAMPFPCQASALFIGRFATQGLAIELGGEMEVVGATFPLGRDRELDRTVVEDDVSDRPRAAGAADIRADQGAIS